MMSSGLKERPVATTTRKRKIRPWMVISAILALILASALVGWFTTPKPARVTVSPTPGAVQDAGTGQQGAVGEFSQPLAPEQNQQQSGATAPDAGAPSGTTQGTTGQTTPGAAGDRQAQDMGAGSSGITTATDTLGGSTPEDGTTDVQRLNKDPRGRQNP